MSRLPPLEAPADHGGVLAVPPLSEAGALAEANRRRLDGLATRLLDRPLSEARRQARAEVLASARTYLDGLNEPAPPEHGELVFMAGHQPELVHPGVWLKHFVLAGLARRYGGRAVNLVVDNDAVHTCSLSVPRVTLPLPPADEHRPSSVPVPFDRVSLGVPHEEWQVQDEAMFASLPEHALHEMASGWKPLLPDFWAEAVRVRSRLAGDRITSARRAFERRWGCHNFEVPVSAVCRSETAARFVAHVLADLPRFHAVYNACVREHRRAHRIKSRNHPVPDLASEGGWLEAPFWAWRAGATRRRRLFVRRGEDRLALRAGLDDEWPSLPLGRGADPVDRLGSLEAAGLKVRFRALTNTLFARLLVADLFVHGIGGARYDELTDGLIRRYFEVEPPGYLVVSGTLLLPLPSYPSTDDDVRRLARLVRDLEYNPQRYLPADPVAEDLAGQKERWVEDDPEAGDAKIRRWQTIRSLNESLTPFVEERRQRADAQLARSRRELEANTLLRRRDWAFCLYPEADLRAFCTRMLNV